MIAGHGRKEFMRQAIEQRMAAAQVANDFLRDEAEKLKTKLEASEAETPEVSRRSRMLSLSKRTRTSPLRGSRS